MIIVIGRGNRRQVFEIPCAAIVNRFEKPETDKVRDMICQLLNIL